MKIETKFNIGDDVFILFDNKIVVEEVTTIHTRTSTNAYNLDVTEISYVVSNINKVFGEDKLFATKQELLDSL